MQAAAARHISSSVSQKEISHIGELCDWLLRRASHSISRRPLGKPRAEFVRSIGQVKFGEEFAISPEDHTFISDETTTVYGSLYIGARFRRLAEPARWFVTIRGGSHLPLVGASDGSPFGTPEQGVDPQAFMPDEPVRQLQIFELLPDELPKQKH